MIRIVINADDFGYSDGTCKAIIELIEAGAVSTTSLMVAAPGALKRIDQWNLRKHREMVGVHLQLSSGKPLCHPSQVQSIVNMDTGYFKDKVDIPNADPDHVYKEWKLQIDSAIKSLGCPPSHLDSHHGFHRLPQFNDVYVALASEYGTSARSGTAELDETMRISEVPYLDRVIREWTGRWLGVDGIHDILNSILSEERKPQTVELASHPGYCDDYLRSISTLNEARDGDRTALMQLAKSDWLSQNGFELTSYVALRSQ
jgi:predicted glycoside hydrolase/deacetylase ChbG (UPF0249 family)